MTLTDVQIETALRRVEPGLEQYCALQVRVTEGGGVFADGAFRRLYNRFYRIRRGVAWQEAFYGLLARSAGAPAPPEFRSVLRQLHEATSRYETSFASKLVATLDPHRPVLDKWVLDNVGLRLPPVGASDRFERICDVCTTVEQRCLAFLATAAGASLLVAFDRRYPNVPVTAMKKLDLVLWQSREAR